MQLDRIKNPHSRPIWITVGIFLVLGIIVLMMWGCPQYNVWQKNLNGQAELAEANWNRQIAIEEAEATYFSAFHYARAESIRATGVGKAITVIGTKLQNNEAYLRYLWINGLHDGSSEVIYIPTEGGLPVLEAGGRFEGK